MDYSKIANTTWREQLIIVKAKAMETVYFTDTFPNYYLINNLSPCTLYMSVNGIPSNAHYDLMVAANNKGLYPRGVGAKQIQIYNDSTEDANIKLISFVAELDPMSLNGLASSTNHITTGGDIPFNGNVKVTEFSVPLPSGTNNLGSVGVSSMPTLSTYILGELPTGDNHIGQVDVNSIPSIPAGTNNIGIVDIGTMPPIEVTSEPISLKHLSYEGNIGTSETVWTFPYTCNKMLYLTNDGATDVFISFSDTVPVVASVTNGQDGNIRIKAGETIDTFSRSITKLRMISASGTNAIRFLGV